MSELQTPAAPSQAPAEPAASETPVAPASETPAAAPQEPISTPAQPAPPPETPAEPVAPVERVVPAADGYKLPEGVPAEVGQFANDNNMTQEQLDATLTHFGGVISASKAAEAEAMRSLGEAQLAKWGDQADHNLSLAKRALAQNDPDGSLTKALNESGWGNHPAVLTFLHKIGVSMQEGGFLKSAVNRPPGQKTAAQAMYGDTHPSTES
jgi:hypothetical protein